MKNTTAILFLFLTVGLQSMLAQNDSKTTKLDGLWIAAGQEGKISKIGDLDNSAINIAAFKIVGDEIIDAILNKDNTLGALVSYKQNKGEKIRKISFQNNNNAVYTWVNYNEEYGWTETHIFNFSLIAKDYMAVHWFRIVNNKDAADSEGKYCFENGKCFTKEKVFYFERYKGS